MIFVFSVWLGGVRSLEPSDQFATVRMAETGQLPRGAQLHLSCLRGVPLAGTFSKMTTHPPWQTHTYVELLEFPNKIFSFLINFKVYFPNVWWRANQGWFSTNALVHVSMYGNRRQTKIYGSVSFSSPLSKVCSQK